MLLKYIYMGVSVYIFQQNLKESGLSKTGRGEGIFMKKGGARKPLAKNYQNSVTQRVVATFFILTLESKKQQLWKKATINGNVNVIYVKDKRLQKLSIWRFRLVVHLDYWFIGTLVLSIVVLSAKNFNFSFIKVLTFQ